MQISKKNSYLVEIYRINKADFKSERSDYNKWIALLKLKFIIYLYIFIIIIIIILKLLYAVFNITAY